jgi:ribonucrease Y
MIAAWIGWRLRRVFSVGWVELDAMQVDLTTILAGAGFAAAGFGAGVAVYQLRERALRAELASREKDLEARLRGEAEKAAREVLSRHQAELERSIAERATAIAADETRIVEREQAANRILDRMALREEELKQGSAAVEAAREQVERERTEVRRIEAVATARLEQASGLGAAEARTMLMAEVERTAARDAADLSRHLLDAARTHTEAQARRILATALQRYAATHTFETTTATVALTGDDMKGRIIGREGRNIRAFEAATGVTVLVDDTPNAVVLSAFDPVRRDVARQAMERLILDGRIHPVRIEEVVAAVNSEMDAYIQKTGEDAVFRANIPQVAPEVARLLGKLRFRHSYSQNVLEHSVEVAHLAGLMAVELGEDALAARRAGLLHDIGKALSHEIEGPHAIVGADFLKRNGETPLICNAVAAHHDEAPHESAIGVLVAAADAISASRPGARSESMTTYLQRLENLERIATGFDGVERAFAVQAGRELRVVVRPESIDDAEAHNIACKIARQIEDEMVYPGQIRVTVVREKRCIEFAK